MTQELKTIPSLYDIFVFPAPSNRLWNMNDEDTIHTYENVFCYL